MAANEMGLCMRKQKMCMDFAKYKFDQVFNGRKKTAGFEPKNLTIED